MSTKTPTKKASAAERERELEQILLDAQSGLADVRQRAEQHRDRIAGLKTRYAERTITAPEDFTESGVAKPKTPTAEIVSEIEKLTGEDNYGAMIRGAEGRVERAEEELRRHRAERIHDLFIEAEPAAEAAVEKWMEWVERGWEIHRELVEIAARSTHLVVGVQGDSQSVPDYGHQAHVLKLAAQRPPLPLPGSFVQEREAIDE